MHPGRRTSRCGSISSQKAEWGNRDPLDTALGRIRVSRVYIPCEGKYPPLITDVGDALFGCTEVEVPGPNRFISPAYYASLGFAVPASIGIKAAFPDKRPLVMVGDGSFQMTGMEVSTAVRYQMDPIIVVLNNSGYGTERPMLDGPFNDVAVWNYSAIPDIIGTGRGFIIRTEEEFGKALAEAGTYEGPDILEVVLDRHDSSTELPRLTRALVKNVK
jgi:TPP-dependent 2-oxoacid decarboxylase